MNMREYQHAFVDLTFMSLEVHKQNINDETIARNVKSLQSTHIYKQLHAKWKGLKDLARNKKEMLSGPFMIFWTIFYSNEDNKWYIVIKKDNDITLQEFSLLRKFQYKNRVFLISKSFSNDDYIRYVYVGLHVHPWFC